MQWFNNHLRSFGVPIESTKVHIGKGKYVNAYFVHQPEWEAVKTLVTLRTQGIEESLQDADVLDTDTVQRQVSAFINELSEKPFKPGYKVRFDKLDEQCRLTGLTDLRDEMAAAFAPFMQEIDDQNTRKYDPPSPLFINNNMGQGGSSNHTVNTSNHVGSAHIEGGEERPSLEFPESATHDLSNDQRQLISTIAEIAIKGHRLRPFDVAVTMLAYGLDSFAGSAEAWAGSVKQAIEECI